MRQAGKKIRQIVGAGGGHGPFRGLDAPFALRMTLKNLAIEVNGARWRESWLTTCFFLAESKVQGRVFFEDAGSRALFWCIEGTCWAEQR
jgi:hypothetical protein